jgi:hypothetical protein
MSSLGGNHYILTLVIQRSMGVNTWPMPNLPNSERENMDSDHEKLKNTHG